jgi:uncharacterized surface protein with fasciclin (FAS1) repeats
MFYELKGVEIIRKMKLFGVLVALMVISLMLFASGCAQKADNEAKNVANETKKAENETKKAENETRNIKNETENIKNETENLKNETEGVKQEIANVVEKSNVNIVQTLADKNFVTLVQLINVAGLEKVLAEDGIYTVFAPTDKAFAELPEGAVPALKNNTNELKKVLTYHVVAGKVLMKKDIENMTSIKTLEGGELTVNVTANGVQVGGANITEANIMTKNGVIHQIDKVLIPPR